MIRKREPIDSTIYTAGSPQISGGWFEDVRVRVRQNFKGVDVKNGQVTPAYPANSSTEGQTYAFDFEDTWGDGVRIIGKPGGEDAFTSIAELEVYCE